MRSANRCNHFTVPLLIPVVLTLLLQLPVQAQVDPFDAIAKKYREAVTKPTLPEDAHRLRVQAEVAIRDKDLTGAADLYRQALAVAPWWPEGHFNHALVLGELQKYEAAITAMRHYLALVPQAPDVRAAQDKIYEWERIVAVREAARIEKEQAAKAAARAEIERSKWADARKKQQRSESIRYGVKFILVFGAIVGTGVYLGLREKKADSNKFTGSGGFPLTKSLKATRTRSTPGSLGSYRR